MLLERERKEGLQKAEADAKAHDQAAAASRRQATLSRGAALAARVERRGGQTLRVGGSVYGLTDLAGSLREGCPPGFMDAVEGALDGVRVGA